jgi:phage minor structural protein
LIEILDRQMNRIARLENAYDDGYEKRFNEVGSHWFTLPLDDPKNSLCNAFNFVKYTLDDEYIGLYRIVPKLTQKDASRNEIQYECQHVIGTLLDSVLFRYHQTTNWTTRQNIEYILSHQTEERWFLRRCDFTRYFHYKWESESGLLAPMFSIAEPIDEEYEWQFDTTSFPWAIDLVKPETEPSCIIREAHNRVGIEKEEPNDSIVNRLYALGYGEGTNQQGIEEVNGGLPYIEDTDSIAKYGLQSYVWTDRRFEDAETLKANAESLLKKWANPAPMYRISAADLKPITGDDIDNLKCGRVVRVYDSDLGVFDLRIMSERKDDARGNPGDVQLELGSLTEDIASVQADLERKQKINDVYSQGATNVYADSLELNCDPDNPAVFKFYIYEEFVKINKLDLTFETTNFEGYIKAMESAGQIVESSTTESGGDVVQANTTQSGGSVVHSQSYTSQFASPTFFLYTSPPVGVGTGQTPPYEEHTHAAEVEDDRLSHSHVVPISISIPAHSHPFSINIPAHDHPFSISIPGHVHPITYGLFKNPNLPSSIQIKVDGNVVNYNSLEGENLDLTPYLEKDSGGKIARSRWATIEITPNDLAKIRANLFVQMFIQSRGTKTL